MPKMKLLKKLTIAKVLGRRVDKFNNDDPVGKERILMTVYGRADSAEQGTHTLANGDVSEYVKFRGSFAAIEPGEDATECRSGVMILPEVAGDMLYGMVGAEGVESVNFGFNIGIRKTETTVGYEYFAEPLIEQADSDPLAALRSTVLGGVLPAPEKTEETHPPAKKGNSKAKSKGAEQPAATA